MWYKVTILYRLGNKRSTAPAPRQRELKTKATNETWSLYALRKKRFGSWWKRYLQAKMSFIVWKNTKKTLSYPYFTNRLIHKNQKAVSSTGVYVMRSITNWLRREKFVSTLQLIQPVQCWPEKSHERCLTVLFLGEINSIDKSQFILLT